MSLHRHTRSVDGTIPVPALLYNDEDSLASQDGVGIYDGTQKAPNHQNGTIYVTTHRLFYIDTAKPLARSFSLDLSSILRTEYYAGLFTSSPKVTLHLTSAASSAALSVIDGLAGESWTCEVCNFHNPPGSSPAAAKCGLCGVPRAKFSSSASTTRPSFLAATAIAQPVPLSSSLPVSPTATPAPSEIACSACTFLNPSSLRECEICGTRLPHTPPALNSAPASRPTSPMPPQEEPDSRIMKLSFRKGGDKALYAVLKRSLLGKAWEARDIVARPDESGAAGSGIYGLLRSVETSAQTRQTGMDDALKDLEALMIKARDMVRLAGELNERLTASSSLASNPYGASSDNTSFSSRSTLVPSTEPEEATFVRSSLAQLGLQMQNTPVTLDMIRDEKQWHDELARELAGVLQGSGGKNSGVGMLGERGIVGLDEVWGGWNRARGIALIPPSTFLQVLPYLPTHTAPPIHLRIFPSTGLRVLHTPAYAPAPFAKRLCDLIDERGARTALEVAWAENVPVGLVAEMIGEAEMVGEVCRDEGQDAGGVGEGVQVRWWVNVFKDYVWDGQT
ncbi:hypothetical protein EW146_g4671 [Bondarzewia mesenterica]|uniref:Vacuolar protein-sorting-associated protein 36 n=1 Tax=Bondarzewia mesenterica TaxID=1095465 RepID=A0A4S4LUB6_9AGAM|nr:hypothetical protein EW146_g4671 [Bondarzewia mesenterica]